MASQPISSPSRTCAPAVLAVLVAAGALCRAPSAHACRDDSEADRAAAVRRADQLSQQLAREATRVSNWRAFWGSAYAVAAVGQLGLGVTTHDAAFETDMLVGSVKSTIGVAGLIVLPVEVDHPDDLSGTSPCQRVTALEQAMARARKSEEGGRSWLPHLGAVAVNAAGVVFIGLTEDRWLDATLAAAVGFAVGEIQLWTQPAGALSWSPSPAASTAAPSRPTAARWSVIPLLHPGGAGLTLTVSP